MPTPPKKVERPNTKAVTQHLTDLREVAESLDDGRAPTRIAAALVAGAPEIALTDLDHIITQVREGGVGQLFHDDMELRTFYRVMGERILARMLVLTENTLLLLDEKLQKTPLSHHSLRNLSVVLDSLTRQAQGVAEIADRAQKAQEAAIRRRNDMSVPELAKELQEKRAALAAVHAE